MAKNILLLDDDPEFNKILTNIFVKADYNVVSCKDPGSGIELMDSQAFDLVITDMRLPTMSGLEFGRMAREKNSRIALIVVSAYLDGGTIREFINLGVDSIFTKPLNVFSLLEKTSKLLKSRTRGDISTNDGSGLTINDIQNLALYFPFRTYPCVDVNTRRLANILYYKRHFRGALFLIGERGSPFDELVDDLKNFPDMDKDGFIEIFGGEELSEEGLSEVLKGEKGGEGVVTLVIKKPLEEISYGGIKFLTRVIKREIGVGERKLRIIIRTHETLSSLLKEGWVDEEFYMLSGCNEVVVPNLSQCRLDIVALMQGFLKEGVEELNTKVVPVIRDEAMKLIVRYVWPGNYNQLRDMGRDICSWRIKGEITEKQVLEWIDRSEKEIPVKVSLRGLLEKYRDDYVEAVYYLLGGNEQMAAQYLAINRNFLDKIVKGAG